MITLHPKEGILKVENNAIASRVVTASFDSPLDISENIIKDIFMLAFEYPEHIYKTSKTIKKLSEFSLNNDKILVYPSNQCIGGCDGSGVHYYFYKNFYTVAIFKTNASCNAPLLPMKNLNVNAGHPRVGYDIEQNQTQFLNSQRNTYVDSFKNELEVPGNTFQVNLTLNSLESASCSVLKNLNSTTNNISLQSINFSAPITLNTNISNISWSRFIGMYYINPLNNTTMKVINITEIILWQDHHHLRLSFHRRLLPRDVQLSVVIVPRFLLALILLLTILVLR